MSNFTVNDTEHMQANKNNRSLQRIIIIKSNRTYLKTRKIIVNEIGYLLIWYFLSFKISQ